MLPADVSPGRPTALNPMFRHAAVLFAASRWCCRCGNVAVSVALLLSVLMVTMVFVIDTGYLYSEKNRYQNAVEAAAIAGAGGLCADDPVATARAIAAANGLPVDAVTVRVGFYDADGRHGDFGTYRDFVAAGQGDYPEEEVNNAVMVALQSDEPTLLSGPARQAAVCVAATAVAYVRQYGLVSRDTQTGIALEGSVPVEFRDGAIYAGAAIDYTGTYSFVNVALHPFSPETDAMQPLNDTTLERLLAADDVDVLGPSDFGTHPVFWDPNGPSSPNRFPIFNRNGSPYMLPVLADAFDPSNLGSSSAWGPLEAEAYYIDLSRMAVGTKLFFDAGDREDVLVIIALENPNPPPAPAVQGITFMANCPVLMRSRATHHISTSSHYGGEGAMQVGIYSTRTIVVQSANVYTHGVFFRTGGDFGVRGEGGSSGHVDDMASVIADGAIKIAFFSGFQEVWGLRFAPPCAPPFVPRLGLLEVVP